MKTKKLVITALFVALSFAGSYLKIFGTIAFDSLPAFLGSLVLGPAYGAAIGFMGHVFTATLSGFPFGALIHIIIAVAMAFTMFCFGHAYKLLKNKLPQIVCFIIAGLVGVALNAPFALSLLIPFMGMPAVLGLLPVLALASAANVVVAIVIFRAFEKSWGKAV